MSKTDLIDMIISEKNKNIAYAQEDDDLSKEEPNELLKNNKIPPELKAKPKI